MSLQVWLPLNGDLHNQGLMPITFSTTTVNWNAAGKIGQAFSTLNSNVIGTCPNLNGVTTFSLTFWCFPKTNSSITTNWCNIIALGSKSADNSTSAEFRFESSYGNTYILSHHNNSGDPIGGGTASLVSERDKWYHVAVVVNNESHTIRYYVNGVQLTTSGFLKTHNGGHLDGTIKLANENVDPDCLLNDVRIYDHALSAKEVEEVAKGLVVHYKLDDMNLESTINLVSSSNAASYNYIEKSVANYATNIVSKAEYGNKIFTYSAYIKNISDHRLAVRFNPYNAADSDYSAIIGNYIEPGEEGYSTVTADITDTSRWNGKAILYVQNGNGGTIPTNKTFYIKEVQLEENNHRTAFTPNSRTSTIVYDCSGYNNNGTYTGTGINTLSSNTPRYDNSLRLSKKKISSTIGFPSGPNPDFTVIFWAKIYSDITYVSYGDLFGMSDSADGANSPFRLELCGSPASNNLMWFRGPSGQASGGFNMNSSSTSGWFSKDVWHQIALVGNGTTKQYMCYLDGNQCGSYNGSANTWTPTGAFYVGDTVEATASFSDVRIYATILTADQIKELYNTSMSIDNQGNIHIRELVEI